MSMPSFYNVAGGALDDAGGDRPGALQRSRVVQVIALPAVGGLCRLPLVGWTGGPAWWRCDARKGVETPEETPGVSYRLRSMSRSQCFDRHVPHHEYAG
jgi:hypothetical protein